MTLLQALELSKSLAKHNPFVRMTLDCTSLAITRGNLKVLYYGSIDRLKGLPKALTKVLTPS